MKKSKMLKDGYVKIKVLCKPLFCNLLSAINVSLGVDFFYLFIKKSLICFA